MLKIKGKKAFAMIVCVAVLAVLTIILIAFTISARYSLSMAKNYVASVKAKYLAEAAIARAIAELKYGSDGAINNSVDTTSENWYGANPYSETNISLGGGGWTGDYTVTNIVDCASQINISDGNPNLDTMLSTLNSQIGSPLDDPADIDAIANNAPYETKRQILSILTGSQTERENKYDAIKDYITVFSYTDPYTINPHDIEDPVYELQPRAPVNVNTASKEVLVAVLNGIKAINACSHCGGDGIIKNNQTCPACGGGGDLEISSTEASDLADYIITNRSISPYRTWSEFYSSIKSCVDIGEKDADLVMANSNPNTGFSWVRNAAWREDLGDIGKYVVDFDKDGGIDSYDKGLTINTTEFSFSSGGYYQIETEAQIRDSLDNIVAEKKLIAVAKIFDIYRETNQAHFDAGTKSDIQSYPEPVEAGISSATYSGQLTLSTLTHTQPSSGTHFRADYRTTLSADSGGGTLSPQDGAGKPEVGSVSNFSSRGELMPDGMLVDYFDAVSPNYNPLDNVDADEGTIVIWFKPMYPSYDPMIYGDLHRNRKILDLTSAEEIYGVIWAGTYNNFLPYIEAYIYDWPDDDGIRFCSAGWCGGEWKEDEWWRGSSWWNLIPEWQKGEWLQLAWTWKNPDDPYDSSQYNTTDNPFTIYFNGDLEREYIYYYHTAYDETELMDIGHDGAERSSAVIGSVQIYPDRLSDAEIQANYLTGIYETSGTFTSSTLDPPDVDNVEWGTITWTEAIGSTSGDFVFDVDTGGGFGGNYSDPSTNNTISATTSSISYSIDFSSSANRDTPVLEDVTITYLGPTKILYWSEVHE